MGPDSNDLGRLFRTVLDPAPLGVVVVDQSRRIVLANTWAKELFHYPESELLGKPIEALLPKMAQATRVARDAEVDAVRKNGSTFTATVRYHAVEGAFEAFFISDMTAEQNWLRQNQQLMTLPRFVSSVAEDLRTGLSAISASAEVLSNGIPEDNPLREQVLEILEVCQKATALTRHLAFVDLQN